LERTPLRVYLTGPVCAERGPVVVQEGQFPGRQSRLLFAYLLCQQAREASKEDLAEVLWADAAPAAWDAGLKSLVSKLRRCLGPLNLSITTQFGRYRLPVPTGAWIDLEAARNAVDEAEGALRRGDIRSAWGPANVALTIAGRPFLPGEEGGWANEKRRELQDCLVRALDCYTTVCLEGGEASLAAQTAGRSVALEPFRETGYQLLMQAHAAAGNRAEALRVYQQCRQLLSDELGVDPSTETEALYLKLLVK
jgi:SARP family transcriptional regulator, regulator of embCAB operon